VTALVLLAGCTHPHAGADARCSGDAVIVSDEQLDAIGRCAAYDGSLQIRGAGELDLTRLAKVERITGDLTIGPTFGLDVVDLEHLRAVGGALRIVSNGAATGAYLPALEQVGSLEISSNVGLAGVALPSLTRIGGDLVVDGNPVLENLTAAKLQAVGGQLVMDRNPQLTLIEIPDELARPHDKVAP
jgi:hypothetical protein